jgi:ribosomal peptide maturation radical SAM protein 1
MGDVLLVSMPFGPLFSPSIALSLLKAALAAHGIPAEVRYFSLDFAERIGQSFYCDVGTEGRPPLVMLAGEWIFSGGLFPPRSDAEQAYVADILQKPGPATARGSAARVTESRARRVLKARADSTAFLDGCLREIVARRPKVLAFTSIFQQHLASLALAKRVKAALPETVIVMGGANCEGIMGAETARQFPFVDAVVSGEGEVLFPELVARVLAGEGFADLQGVRTPDGVGSEFRAKRFSNARTVTHMDDLPYPDFSEFFEQFEASRFSREWEASLFYETSRGCWWGEHHHCTFCGLNGSSMAFRSKSAGRAIAELEELARKHPSCDIQVVDNILDMGYFKDFLPILAERKLGLDLFYETKSNLKKEHVRLLRSAGISRIQPGIESLSDSVLNLMRKGVSALQNVQLLKWCKELGVEPHWNVLWGFPGEDPEEYTRLARLVPSITHLPGPVGFSDIRLDRFSPNFFDAQELGFANIRPLPSYAHVYPGLSEEARANLAYFFGFDYREPRDVGGYVGPLVMELRAWMKATKRGDSDLFSVDLGDRLLVWDLRPAAGEALTVLDALDRALLLACDAATEGRALSAGLRSDGFPPASGDEIEARLARLVSRRLAVKVGSRYLALALPLGEYVPAPAVLARFDRVVRKMAEAPASRRGGRRAPETLRISDFVLDDRGDLVVREAFRIRLGAKAVRRREKDGEEDGRNEQDARDGRPLEVR